MKLKSQRQKLRERLGYYQLEFDHVESVTKYQKYYVEFNIKQQRNYEKCIIDNNQVVKPSLHIKCLSDIRVKDIRKFVYHQVKDLFSQLDPSNIELAYRRKVPTPPEIEQQWKQVIKHLHQFPNPG